MSPSAQRLVQLHHLDAALADYLRAREVNFPGSGKPAPAGHKLIRPPTDEVRDHPRLGRIALARLLVWRLALSRRRPRAASVLRARVRLRGLLLWRSARRRHQAKASLPLSPLWRDRTTGAVRPLPRWLLDPPHTTHHRRQADHLRGQTKMIAPVGHAYPFTWRAVTRAGDGGDYLTPDEVNAFWTDFFSDPVGFYQQYISDFVDPAAAQAWIDDYLADPIGWLLANKYADTVAGQAFTDVPIGDMPLTPLLKDPEQFWTDYTEELYPAEDVEAWLAEYEADPIAFWARYGDAADLTPEELAAASDPTSGADPAEQAAIDTTLGEVAGALAFADGALVAEGGVLSDLQVLQLLDSYWAGVGVQVGALGAAEDAGVAAGLLSSWDIINPAALDYLRQQSGWLITQIDENTRAQVAESLWADYRGLGGAEALNMERLAASLQRTMDALGNDLAGMSRYRALMIARTETARAVSFGTMVAYAKMGSRFKRWIVNAGACQRCIGNGEAGDIPLNQDFPSGVQAPPQHPKCRCAIGAGVSDQFNAEDWATSGFGGDDIDNMLFDPAYGFFPNVDWPDLSDVDASDLEAPASPDDLGLIDYAALSPALQDVLTPDAVDALAAQLGGSAEDAATTWADEQGVDVPETDAQVQALGNAAALPGDPQGLALLGDALAGTLDDWASEMDLEGS